MKWLKDPFRSFLVIYGGLIVIATGLLVLTQQSMSEWYLEQSAEPLLEAEAILVEQAWYEDGPEITRAWLAEEKSSLFHYQLKPIINDEKLPETSFASEQMEQEDAEYLVEDSYLFYESGEGDSLEGFVALETYLPDGESWQPLVIAVNATYFNEQLSSFNTLIYTIVAILLLGFAVAWAMIQRIKTRLTDINRISQQIQNLGDLSTKIPTDDLVGPLADTITQINQMLSTIERSVDQTKQQANNIAHDLRTPLTVVYQRVQQAVQDHPELIELESLLGRLLQTFNLLLRIHRLESNGESPQLEPVDVRALVDDVAELYLPAMEDKQQQLHLDISVSTKAMGNADLLFQVLCNLLDNASKYSPPESMILLKAEHRADTVCLTVSDQGGGVNDAELPQLCEKFYRLDSSRHHAGNGLGLSFAKAAIERMHGDIDIKNSSSAGVIGLEVSICLPQAK